MKHQFLLQLHLRDFYSLPWSCLSYNLILQRKTFWAYLFFSVLFCLSVWKCLHLVYQLQQLSQHYLPLRAHFPRLLLLYNTTLCSKNALQITKPGISLLGISAESLFWNILLHFRKTNSIWREAALRLTLELHCWLVFRLWRLSYWKYSAKVGII